MCFRKIFTLNFMINDILTFDRAYIDATNKKYRRKLSGITKYFVDGVLILKAMNCAKLLNHATIDEIKDGTRKFAKCTWISGRDSTGTANNYLTCWYELCGNKLLPIDFCAWKPDQEF